MLILAIAAASLVVFVLLLTMHAVAGFPYFAPGVVGHYRSVRLERDVNRILRAARQKLEAEGI